MRLVVLAAGYATRLYPLTRDQPKHLLAVAGRPVLEHVLERLAAIDELEEAYLVTNRKFAGQFRDWAAGYDGPLRPEIVDDGTTSEDDRLGAIGDLGLILRESGTAEDTVVVAGDNIFTESLAGFGRSARELRASLLGVYDVGDLEAVRKYNAIEVDDDGRVSFFEEKPNDPRSTLTGIALYYYPSGVLPLVERYLDEGNNPDQPGRLVQWLYRRVPVYAWRVPGLWLDIGSRETLDEADRLLTEGARAGR